MFYNVGGICVLMCLGVVCPGHAGEVEHAHYTVHIMSIIHTRGNSYIYITSINMRCGKVANLNYGVFLSFHKLTLENKMYYLYLYSFTIETMLKTLFIHCDLNQINIVSIWKKTTVLLI